MTAREKLHETSLYNTESLHKKEIELLKGQKTNTALYWILVIAADIIGLLAGLFFK